MGTGWWVATLWNENPVLVISWVFWIIFSICLHELAHGWTAIRLGDRTPIDSGHMTWNPLVHMGAWSLVMFAMIGIAWGAMPVDPTRLRGRHADAMVAGAGPATNITLALIALALLTAWVPIAGGLVWSGVRVEDQAFANVVWFLRLGIMLNVALAAFNMIPVPPLDGSRVLASFSRWYDNLFRGEHAAGIAMVLFVGVFLLAADPIFGMAFRAADHAAVWALDLVSTEAVLRYADALMS
ncbi:MAG: site-2 protease family protein [Phycisphaerales bacterium]|nr:site-2 protease family protein [Phycisphaerales bacterium]